MTKNATEDQKVLCKYLKVPITDRVWGVRYSRKIAVKIMGPFYSLGVAIRYYMDCFNAGTLKNSKYTQYLMNIAEQLDMVPEEYRAVKTPEERAEHQKAIRKSLEQLAAPHVSELETYGGKLTLSAYLDKDKTYADGKSGKLLTSMTLAAYNTARQREAETRYQRRLSRKNTSEYTLYVIDWRPDVERPIARIPLDNQYFTQFIKGKLVTRVQTSNKFQGCRIIWSHGQHNNTRATKILYGRKRRDNKENHIKGVCYVLCTQSADLRLQGVLQVDNGWKPILDSGDMLPDSEPIVPPPVPKNDEDSDSSSDSSSDEEDEDPKPDFFPLTLACTTKPFTSAPPPPAEPSKPVLPPPAPTPAPVHPPSQPSLPSNEPVNSPSKPPQQRTKRIHPVTDTVPVKRTRTKGQQ